MLSRIIVKTYRGDYVEHEGWRMTRRRIGEVERSQ